MLPGGSPGLPLSQSLPCLQALEGELQAAVTSHQEKVAELQVQLTQKEQTAEYYKGQVCWGASMVLQSLTLLESLTGFLCFTS